MSALLRAGLFLMVPAVLSGSAVCSGGSEDGIPLDAPEGQELILNATHASPFIPLSIRFTTELPGKCGPATAVMLLNALRAPAPVSPLYSNATFNFTTHYWDQLNVFDGPCAEKATHPYNGSIEQVASFVSCRGIDVQVVRAHTSSAAFFRDSLKAAFAGSGQQLVAVNFARHLVGQVPAIGHHSPIGAYDEQSDRVLVMDVARYKYPPVWHCLERLFHAMAYNEPEPMWNMSTPRGWWTARFASAAEPSASESRIIMS